MYRRLWIDLLLYAACLPSYPATPSDASQPWTWGPYRPNLYFGLRPQIPETLLVGLMWANGESEIKMLQTLRDTCEQDDGMEGYGWTTYDTRQGGTQVIHDSGLGLDLTTDFFKMSQGDSWGVRIAGTPRKEAPKNLRTALVLHIAQELVQSDSRKNLSCESRPPDSAGTSPIRCHGYDPELGAFEFQIKGDAKHRVIEGIGVKSQFVPEDDIWKAKPIYIDAVYGASSKTADDTKFAHGHGSGNMHFIEVIFEGPFQLYISYRQKDGKLIDSEVLNQSLSTLQAQFPERVDRVFPRTSPFTNGQYSVFVQSTISNLLGGLGFFHGDSLVDDSHATEYAETELGFWTKSAAAMKRANVTMTPKQSLISHVPSRPFFPRGFLWDEGFHLLPIIEWDLDLAIQVLQSWFTLMDEDGWIGRTWYLISRAYLRNPSGRSEQILGSEARSKVPEEFQIQYPHFANPPTLITLLPLVVSKIVDPSSYRGNESKFLSSPEGAKITLKNLFNLASRHYDWFRQSQAGNFTAYPRPEGANTEGYRWKGRTPSHTLTSGLDDYPRPEPPHPGELHVDALAWVGAAADALRQTAEFLGENPAPYVKHLDEIRHNLDTIHWDPDAAAYCDTTINEAGAFSRVCRIGYVSLLPFILGHVGENHPHLAAVLDSMSDARILLSKYGLRSLSATDENYGTGEDYWRGAVWINLNVLTVLRLQSLNGSSPSVIKAHTLALDLRERLVNSVFKNWVETGFFWEQYDDKTGQGKRSRAFTGWTACIILLMGNTPSNADGDAREHSRQAISPGSVVFGSASIILIAVILFHFRQKFSRLWEEARYYSGLYRQRLLGTGLGQHQYEEIINLDER